jgi:hypothetical protein
MDNSSSHKEGISRTYKGCDGYATMPAYLGQEGYCLELELREGKQHCQKDTPALLTRVLKHAQKIKNNPILLGLDGGNDSIENIDVLIEHNRENTDKTPVDFIIKWNPRREKKESWLDYAEQHGRWTSTRDGKREALFSVEHKREWQGYEYTVWRVIRLIERSMDKKGQLLLERRLK